MKFLQVVVLLVGATWAEEWSVTLESTPLIIDMDHEINVPFSVTFPENTLSSKIKLVANSTDVEVADAEVPKFINSEPGGMTRWNDSIIIKGVFLGKAKISLWLPTETGTLISKELEITVIRGKRLVDTLFIASVIILVSVLYISFGCAIDWPTCIKTLKKPVGPAVGAFCQFIIMPLLSYIIGYLLFPGKPEMQIGIFFTGISPSGGASNMWTVLLGGNLNLSVTMTTLGTIASFATMPIWMFTLGKRIFDNGKLAVPYSRIAEASVGLIIPLALGFLIQKKFPKFCRILVRIMKPFAVILVLFIIVFATVTNFYLLKLFSWQIVAAGTGLAWMGYICGWVAMVVLRQPNVDVRAIAIETGIQNTGIAIFLLQLILTPPATDLAIVVPVSCAIMTPIPLTIIWLIKLVFERRKKKKLAASMERLQKVAEPVDTTTLPTPQTTLT